MKGIVTLFILLTLVLAFSGCTHTPANVAKEVPIVLKNVSNEISMMETPNVTLESALQPLKTSADYVRPIILPTPTVQERNADPIIGNWQYTGDSGYQCNARFTSDFKASASCSVGFVPLIQKSFIWNPERNIYSWMRNYTITDISDNRDYSIAYSEHTGRLMSNVIPGNGYLVKVD